MQLQSNIYVPGTEQSNPLTYKRLFYLTGRRYVLGAVRNEFFKQRQQRFWVSRVHVCINKTRPNLLLLGTGMIQTTAVLEKQNQCCSKFLLYICQYKIPGAKLPAVEMGWQLDAGGSGRCTVTSVRVRNKLKVHCVRSGESWAGDHRLETLIWQSYELPCTTRQKSLGSSQTCPFLS